jgi:hypothetical protein
MRPAWLLLLLLAGCTACVRKDGPSPTPDAARNNDKRAVVIVTPDMRGYLGPCGCSANMRGGIDRAAHQVSKARGEGAPVAVVDAGDSLFGTVKLTEAQVPQQERKAKALAEAFAKIGLVAKAVGELDDARGAAFREGLKLPSLAAGEGRALFDGGPAVHAVAAGNAEELKAAAKKARAAGAKLVIGLLHQTVDEAQKTAGAEGLGVDLIVASHGGSELAGEESRLVRTAVPVAQVQSKGRSFLRVDVQAEGGAAPFELLRGEEDRERELKALDERIALLNKQVNEPMLAEELKKLRQAKVEELQKRREGLATAPPKKAEGKNAFTVRFIPLEASYASDPAVKAVVESYDRDVAQINLEWARKAGKDCPPPEKGEAAFVGNASCKECHAEAFPVWESTKHAVAYKTLEDVSKQFHLDCVSCHVTGAYQPGGVCRVDKVNARADVGCESCHGPGSIHAEEPSSDNVLMGNKPEACIGCHNPENSPHFDFAAYLPKILGKGHAAKAEKPTPMQRPTGGGKR